MAREVAQAHGVCIRPLMRRVLDRETGTDTRVAIPCGSTHESVCPACATKARLLRIQQCAEGWHRDTEPDSRLRPVTTVRVIRRTRMPTSTPRSSRMPVRAVVVGSGRPSAARMPRICPGCRWRTAPSVAASPPRTARVYRPSMFLTLTLPSYGKVRAGAPVDPDTYDYRRAALDAVLFPRLVDRFWQNLRRVAGYKVQYFAAVEPQQRLAPHLHAALRGTIPRAGGQAGRRWRRTCRCGGQRSTSRSTWTGSPAGTARDYVDPDTGAVLPTWQEALDQVEGDAAGARGPVREAARLRRDHRPITGRGPGHPLSDQVPDEVHR